MTLKQFIIALFAVLIVGLMMPFSYAVRMALFLALTALAVVTFLGGGMQYVLNYFH